MVVRAPLAGLLHFALLAAGSAQAALPEMLAKSVISVPVSVAAPAFTPDGSTVYFHRKEGDERTIYFSHKEGESWSAPAVASFAQQWTNIEPAMAPDGSFMIFASNRPIDGSGKVLDGNWGNSRNLAGAAIYGGSTEQGAAGPLPAVFPPRSIKEHRCSPQPFRTMACCCS